MARTTQIPSVLRQDFSVEDLMFGNFHTTGIENFDVVNKLGCLSSLKDIDNRDPVYFSMEAMNLLGEAEKYGVFAMGELQKMNDRFAICNEISKRYSVEGFSPLMFGAEGFVDTMKKIGSSIVNGFKKLAATLMNFIRSVGNAIGSAIALTQVKLYEKNKGKKFAAGKGGEIKALLHAEPFIEIFGDVNQFVELMNQGLTMVSTALASLISKNTKTKNTPFDGDKFKQIFSSAGFDKAFQKIKNYIVDSKNPYGITKFDAKKAVYKMIYNKDEIVKPVSMNSGDYLTKIPDNIGILSRQSLEAAKLLTKSAQNGVKTINRVIKEASQTLKFMEQSVGNKHLAGSKDKAKEAAGSVKSSREFMNSLNLEYRITTKMTSFILMTFAHFLRCRGYCAAALKAYEKGKK